MAKNDIGGFFVSLGLNPDKNSFETGNKLIDSVTDSFNKLIGTARNAAVVLASTAMASGAMASQEIHTSQVIGTTTEKLNLWRAAAKIAGTDANGLVGAIGKLGNVMNHLTIDGSGLEAYAEQLGKLQIGFDELEGMDPADAMKTIIERAQAQLDGTNETKLRITTIVGDILGEAGQQLFVDLQRQGVTIGDFLNGVGRTQYETDQDKEAAADFVTEARYIKEELTSLTKLFGDSIARELTPYVKELKEWLLDHGPDIAEFLRVLSTNVAKLVEKIVGIGQAVAPTAKEVLKTVENSVKGTLEGTKDMLVGAATGDWEKVGAGAKTAAAATFTPVATVVTAAADKLGEKWEEDEKAELGLTDEEYMDLEEARRIINERWREEYKGQWFEKKNLIIKRMDYNKLHPKYQKIIDDHGGKENFPEVKDGIIRPDGTITKVAPDDWVLAARNLGDLARAFIPQGAGTQIQAPSEYVINQTFNITGSNDIPQVLKAQAYRGTQEGLMDLMAQSSRRLEMMSGTR